MEKILEALRYPLRLQMVEHLAKVDSATVGNLADALSVTHSTASHHLRKLESLDAVTRTVSGAHVFYQLNFTPLKLLSEKLQQILVMERNIKDETNRVD